MRRALAFLTPLGGAAVPDGRTLSWFPLAGAAIGAAVGAGWWAADRVWSPLLAAALAVALDLVLTGLLHADGLADSADGLLPPLSRDRRLEVMAEPTIGAYGVVSIVVVLGLRTAALASMPPDVWLVAAVWCASRTAMAVAARGLPYARIGGLATDLLGGPWAPVAAGGAGLAAVLALGAADPVAAVAAVVAGLLAAAAVAWAAWRRLGGFTGDVLGAAGVVGETVALVVAAGWS
jgi:adenosylcobinamide-GDP ribazoletransferase